jgi:hypothetical protein
MMDEYSKYWRNNLV